MGKIRSGPSKDMSTQKFVDNAQQCLAFTPQANFPAHNLNRIQATLENIFYFTISDPN